MCTLQLSSFRECFPKNHRPGITDLETFWNNGVEILFRNFAEDILQAYDLRFGIPIWSETNGWTYRIGKSGVYLIKGIIIEKNCFIVDGIMIKDKASYSLLLEHVSKVYEQNRHEFQQKIEEKSKRQVQRNQERVKREKEEFLIIQSKIIPGKYNVFHWPAKLDVHKLKRLYMSDAKGIQDMTLVDEIGLTLYMRCKYGKEDIERMEQGIIRCHNCDEEILGLSDFRQCSCGYQYSYREYRRSYRRNNMPTGAAAMVFETFMNKWDRAKSYQEKMIQIDTLLHEFHLSLVSGAAHRPVAMNFMDGTRKSVEAIINELARNN